jgi:hypothetical protein
LDTKDLFNMMTVLAVCASLIFAADAIRTANEDTTTTTSVETTSTVLGECMRNCSGEASSPVYCEASWTAWDLNVPCTMADNYCEASCLLADAMETAKEESPSTAHLVDDVSVDYVYSIFCGTESCMNSTSDPDTESTASCEDDTAYWRMDCPDESGTGCSIQFNVSLDVCQLTTQFTRNDIFSALKMSYVSVVVDSFDYLNGICGESDLSVTAYTVDYNTEAAMLWGTRDITTDADCEEVTAVCGDSYNEKGFSLFASISFYCGDCDDLVGLYTDVLTMMDTNTFSPMYTADCLAESVSFDSLCLDGFGSVEVTDYSMEMLDEDGEEILVLAAGNGAAGKSLMVAGAVLAFMIAL